MPEKLLPKSGAVLCWRRKGAMMDASLEAQWLANRLTAAGTSSYWPTLAVGGRRSRMPARTEGAANSGSGGGGKGSCQKW